MGIPVLILGESGTGKTTSLRNLDPSDSILIQTIRKPLPFKASGWSAGGSKPNVFVTDNWENIVKYIRAAASRGKQKVIIDDWQYLLANEFMRRSTERGFDKFSDIANHAWQTIMTAQNTSDDTRVYFLAHTDTSDDGHVKVKTIGKLLDEKITVEGLFTIVLRTSTSDGEYLFRTQNNGQDTVKSPMGMFDDSTIPNDLDFVDKQIIDYYDLNQQQETAA